MYRKNCALLTVILCEIILLLRFITITSSLTVEDDDIATVKGQSGSWRGKIRMSRNGQKYFSFRGIRYARVRDRFEPPEPFNLNGTQDAFDFGSECPQIRLFNSKLITDTEDCLFLNVHVPENRTTKKLPVLFFIHGGAFIEGSGSYTGADYFMDEDVILVTINYRLGVLGFLDTGDDNDQVLPNNGLRDINFALKWVRNNIGAFEGDATKVTVFGNSAGGDLVHLLMLSPAFKGLFHSAIAHSGSALCSWSVIARAPSKAAELARRIGCPHGNMTTVVACLRRSQLSVILKAQKDMWFIGPDIVQVPFGPTVDSSSSDSIVPDTPLLLLTGNWQNNKHVPFIVGITEYEGIAVLAGAYLSNSTLMSELQRNWFQKTSLQLEYSSFIPKHLQEEFAMKLKHLYFPDGTVEDKMLVQLHTDLFFYRGAKLSVDFHSFQGFKVYPYVFSYRGDFSFSSDWNLPASGATHTDDLQYLFPSTEKKWPDIATGSQHHNFSTKFVKLWSSFATHGEPKGTWSDGAWLPTKVPARLGEGQPHWYWLDTESKYLPENPVTKYRLDILDAMFAEYEQPRLSWRGRPELRDEL